ncbi:hypothetical protein ACHAPV_009619 [Trichoderma viride]
MDDVRKDMKHRGNSRLSQVGTKEGRAVSALRPSRRQIRRGRKRMNHDGRGTGTRGPQLPAVGVMLAPAGVDSELRNTNKASEVARRRISSRLCAFNISQLVRPLSMVGGRWRGRAQRESRPLFPQFVSRLDMLQHRHEQDKYGTQVTGGQPCLPAQAQQVAQVS